MNRRVSAVFSLLLLAACARQAAPSMVDLAEVRGFGDPVVLYEVDRAQAVSDLVRVEIAKIASYETVEDAEVVAGDRPYVRCSFFGDVDSGRHKWARSLVAFGAGGEYAEVYFRAVNDSTWKVGRIDGPAAAGLADAVERVGGNPLALSVRASAEALLAVRKAMTEITVLEGLFAEDLRVESYEAVDFPDASLGCAEPGEFYTQVVTPGFRIFLRGPASGFDLRVAGEIVKICAATEAATDSAAAPDAEADAP